jgi:hypothetical protein
LEKEDYQLLEQNGPKRLLKRCGTKWSPLLPVPMRKPTFVSDRSVAKEQIIGLIGFGCCLHVLKTNAPPANLL